MDGPADPQPNRRLDGSPRVLVGVLSYGERPGGVALLKRLADTGADPNRVVVVVNPGPCSAERAIRAANPGLRVIDLPTNRGYAAGMNRVIAEADSLAADVVVLLTDDVLVDWPALEALVLRLWEDADRALVGQRLVERRDGSIHSVGGWAAGGVVGHDRDPAANGTRQVAWIDGAVLVGRTSALIAIGGFDERYFLYAEDVEVALRLRASGWSAVVDADVIAESAAGSGGRRAAYRYLTSRNLLETWRKQRAWRDLVRRLAIVAIRLVRTRGRSRAEAYGALAFAARRFGPPPARLLRDSDVVIAPAASPGTERHHR